MTTNHNIENAGAEDDPLLKINEVAKRLSVSERHVRNLMRRHLIGFIRLGGALRFETAEVAKTKRRLTISARE